MHELGIATSILDIVRQHVPDERAGLVRRVRVRIGELAGVVPETLEFCFSVAVEGTAYRSAVLHIEHVPMKGLLQGLRHRHVHAGARVLVPRVRQPARAAHERPRDAGGRRGTGRRTAVGPRRSTAMSVITIERKVLEKNDEIAAINRVRFRQHGLFVFNMVSSPGAGKTSLLEAILREVKGRVPIGVIEGDVQTDLDAQRVAKFGVPAVQVITRGGCHLEAPLVQQALDAIDLSKLKVLVIENVGNLVCPANYDLGEELKVVVLSTTEGDDKPLKYPGDVPQRVGAHHQQDRPAALRELRPRADEAQRAADQPRPADLRDLRHDGRRHRRLLRVDLQQGGLRPCVNACAWRFAGPCRAWGSGPSSSAWRATCRSTGGSPTRRRASTSR